MNAWVQNEEKTKQVTGQALMTGGNRPIPEVNH